MSKYTYPGVFTTTNKGIRVTFPDFPGPSGDASYMTEALGVAKEMLAKIMIDLEDNHDEIPRPVRFEDLPRKSNVFVSFVTCDTDKLR